MQTLTHIRRTSPGHYGYKFGSENCCMEFKCLRNFAELPSRFNMDKFQPLYINRDQACPQCGLPPLTPFGQSTYNSSLTVRPLS